MLELDRTENLYNRGIELFLKENREGWMLWTTNLKFWWVKWFCLFNNIVNVLCYYWYMLCRSCGWTVLRRIVALVMELLWLHELSRTEPPVIPYFCMVLMVSMVTVMSLRYTFFRQDATEGLDEKHGTPLHKITIKIKFVSY